MQAFTIEQLFALATYEAKKQPASVGRIARAHALLLNDGVRHAGALEYFVTASDGNGSYIVTIGAQPACTCADFSHRGERCKHILAAEMFRTLAAPRRLSAVK